MVEVAKTMWKSIPRSREHGFGREKRSCFVYPGAEPPSGLVGARALGPAAGPLGSSLAPTVDLGWLGGARERALLGGAWLEEDEDRMRAGGFVPGLCSNLMGWLQHSLPCLRPNWWTEICGRRHGCGSSRGHPGPRALAIVTGYELEINRTSRVMYLILKGIVSLFVCYG